VIWLLAAIAAEVTGTTALARSDGFRNVGPAAIGLVGWGLSLWWFALALETVPVGVGYAIWSGLGTLAMVVIGWVFVGQRPESRTVAGLCLVVGGVLVLNLLSDIQVA
jgi:small multidrug resistance pump